MVVPSFYPFFLTVCIPHLVPTGSTDGTRHWEELVDAHKKVSYQNLWEVKQLKWELRL